MVRIAKLLLLFLFVTRLCASDAGELLQEADRLLQTQDHSKITKAYHNYKSAYINALLDGDTVLADRAKAGVSKSASLLGIDQENVQAQDDGSGNTVDTEEKPFTGDISILPRILSYNANKNQIFLTLSKPIDMKDINSFSLKDKNLNKVIFDFPAVFHKDMSHIKSVFFKDIRIAQYSPDTVRIVMEKGLNFEAEAAVLGNKLVLSAFSVNGQAKPSRYTVPTPSVKEPQPVITNVKKPAASTGKMIFIDPGHGGKDGGAVGYKDIEEKDVVLAIGKELSSELKRRGYRVKMSRDSDIFIPLRDRTHMANGHDSDLFVSIHANSVGRKINIKGIETYFLSPARSERAKKVASVENSSDLKEMSDLSQDTFLSFLNREKVTASNKFAIDLQKNILANLKKNYTFITDNGVREGPFWVLVGAQMPAVLVEVGYITNPTEAKRMKTKKYQKLMAKGIADGIDSFFYYN